MSWNPSVTSPALQLKFLVWKQHWMNLIVFEKTFDIKITTFPPPLETLGHYCVKKKLINSLDPWKSRGVKLQMTLLLQVCSAVYLATFVWAWTVDSFIQHYLHPFFAVCFEVAFLRGLKNIPVFENDFLIYSVVHNACKYKPSQNIRKQFW